MYIRNNNGVVGTDVAISIIILILFVAIVTTIFYQIGMTNISTTRQATATNCVVNIIEYIKLMEYEETFLDTKMEKENAKTWCDNNGIDVPNGYNVTITKSTEDEDIERQYEIQEITVSVSYNIKNEEKSVSIKTLKVND